LTVDFIIEKMLDAITRNVIGYYNLKGLREEELKERWELRDKVKILEKEKKEALEEKDTYFKISTDYYKEKIYKEIENKEQTLKIEELKSKQKELEEKIDELDSEVWMEREEAEKALNTAMK
jgi:hypothetical protein